MFTFVVACRMYLFCSTSVLKCCCSIQVEAAEKTLRRAAQKGLHDTSKAVNKARRLGEVDSPYAAESFAYN